MTSSVLNQKKCLTCKATFSSNTSNICLKCMMNGVIAKQESEERQAEESRLARRAKKSSDSKLAQGKPDRDKQWDEALDSLKKAQKVPLINLKFGLKPKIKPTVMRSIVVKESDLLVEVKPEIKKAAKGPRIVRPPPPKKHPSTFCILCGATVNDIRQHKHDVHHERMYFNSAPTRSAKDNVWVTIYEGGAPGLGKRHS